MKRIAPILLLGILACASDSDRPTMPARETQTSVSPALIDVELFSDEFCKGGNVWWNARFNVFGVEVPEKSEIRVFTIDGHGERTFFGVARTGVPELEGTDFTFYAEGIAPPDSIPDPRGVGNPPNYGQVPFGFDIYAGPSHTLVGTAVAYSDIEITSNLFPHACQGIKPRTGCLFVSDPFNETASQSQVDGAWYWTIGGEFVTGPCVNPTLRLKVYFVPPIGKNEPFARGEAIAVGEFGGHTFEVTGLAPQLDVSSLPPGWQPQFLIEVSSNGTPVGHFEFTAPLALTPNLVITANGGSNRSN